MSLYVSTPSSVLDPRLAPQQKGKAVIEEGSTSQPHKPIAQDKVEIRVRQPEDAPKTAVAHSRGKSIHWAKLPPKHQKTQASQEEITEVVLRQPVKTREEALLDSLQAKLQPRLDELERGAPNGQTQPQKRKNKLTSFLKACLPLKKTGRKKDQPIQTPAHAETSQTKKIKLPIPVKTDMSEAWKLALEDSDALEVVQKPPVQAQYPHAESSRARESAFVSEIEEELPSPVTPKSVNQPSSKTAPKVSLNLSERTIHPETAPTRRPSLKDLEPHSQKGAGKASSAAHPTPGKKARGKEKMGSVDLSLPFEAAMQKLKDAPQTSQTRTPAKQGLPTIEEEIRRTPSERQRTLAKQGRQLNADRTAEAKGKGIDLNPSTRKTAQKPNLLKTAASNLRARLPQRPRSGNTTASERRETSEELDQYLKENPPSQLEGAVKAPPASLETQALLMSMVKKQPFKVTLQQLRAREGKQPAGRPAAQERAPKAKPGRKWDKASVATMESSILGGR